MSAPVTYHFADGVATITIDDGKANALSFAMLAAIGEALDRADADGAIVILNGRPGIFSGGFDLNVMRAGGNDTALLVEEVSCSGSDCSNTRTRDHRLHRPRRGHGSVPLVVR